VSAVKVERRTAVALLGRADGTRDVLRKALEDLGADIVFEGDPSGTQAGDVLKGRPQVVIVNLGAGVEDEIDHLQDVFDARDVNVVYNESDVTSQLSGWDLARWARHFASKVLGHERTIPPPPPGAEPLPVRNLVPVPGAPPTPAQMTPERAIEEFMMEAEDHVDGVPTNHMPVAPPSRRVEEAPAEELSIDVLEIDDMLSQVHTHAEMELSVPEREEPGMVVLEGDAAEFDAGLDLSALDAALQIDTRPPAPQAKKSDAELLDEVLAGFDLGTDDAPPPAADDDEPDFSVAAVSIDDSLDFAPSGEMDADVAALAAQLDALDSGSPRGDVQDLSFIDFSDAPDAKPAPAPAASPPPTARTAAPAATPAPAAAPAAPAAKKFNLDDLELAPLDSGLGGTPEFVKKKDFDFGALELSLEPTPEEQAEAASVKAAAPAVAEAPPASAPPVGPAIDSLDALFAAMDLAPATAREAPVASGISRVIVLGASIGGPDALRSFLGGIPPDFPALFVLVQHLENGFFERLAQQLQKASKLPVRVPSAAQHAKMGEVLVVAANQRVWVEPDGEIVMVDHSESPKYTPCIDDVLRDVADRFGAGATAIIFSGMAGDAVEGAVYLTTQGGEVWAQDPASCVVSSMVDGAKARGVVEFIGSPRELAERCVAKYGNG
jgi:chemotaxis response regulator CheB